MLFTKQTRSFDMTSWSDYKSTTATVAMQLPTENILPVTVKHEDEDIQLSASRPTTLPEHPRKRQRVVMDMVLVPTLAEVQRKKDEGDDDLTKLQKLFKACPLFPGGFKI